LDHGTDKDTVEQLVAAQLAAGMLGTVLDPNDDVEAMASTRVQPDFTERPAPVGLCPSASSSPPGGAVFKVALTAMPVAASCA
jgi:hypothetical protein